MSEDSKIIQMMPADDWYAVFFNASKSQEAKAPMFLEDPLVCWALLEESDGHRLIQGLIAIPDDWDPFPAQEGCMPLPLPKIHPENDTRTLVFLGFARGEKGLTEGKVKWTATMTQEMKKAGWL